MARPNPSARGDAGGTGSGRLAWFGLLLVLIGWMVLVLDLLVAESVLRAGNLVAVTALRGDVATLAQAAILTGLGLAIFGALRQGLGRLNGYFEAVLGPPATTTTPKPVEPAPYERAEPSAPMPPAPTVIDGRAAPSSAGQIPDRNYVILPDGSVEVETLLGSRVFASLDEARDFIR